MGMAKLAKVRCAWAESDEGMRAYHDEEWGVPEYDNRALWELLMLEGFQAGLSWLTVLRKREAFRKAFRRFARAKIEATIKGAQIFLEMKKSDEDFASFLWAIAGGKPIQTQGPRPIQTE